MPSIRQLTNRLNGDKSPDHHEGLVLGLPLEVEDRTIYPVFAEPESDNETGPDPRQIGYLELSEGRSDFVSLEPDYRPAAIVPLLVVLITLLIWFSRRRVSG